MENRDYDALISRLEKTASEHPAKYQSKVIGVAALGFGILAVAIGWALAAVALLGGGLLLIILSGGKALLLFAKLGKALILLALPAWAMVKSSFKLLLSRFPRRQGRRVTREDAPTLFTRLDDIRARTKGPRVHHVLIDNQMNAAIVQHPRFGLLGWEENYLILGLPLLQVLSEQEALAVVAHECGHLSGHHGKLGGFIYRMRAAWGRLQILSEQWNDWGSRIIARLFRWYAPYFNAYTFVFARQNEYVADQTASEIAGKTNTATALMRVKVAAQFENDVFWPSVQRRIATEPEPPNNRSENWAESVRRDLDSTRRAQFINSALQRETDHFDTHPCLKDRLHAIGVNAGEHSAHNLDAVTHPAAEIWFGDRLSQLTREFDDQWRKLVEENWRGRHTELKQQRENLDRLEAIESPTVEQQWGIIQLSETLKPEIDLLPRLNMLLECDPNHLGARYARGRTFLAAQNESGITDIEAVMMADKDAILPGCQLAHAFYVSRDPAKAEHYAARWKTRRDHLDQVQKELETFHPDATVAPANLAESDVEQIKSVLRSHGKGIKKVYLLRRILKSDPDFGDHVLAFETPWLALTYWGEKIVNRLAAQTYPTRMFIVNLRSRSFKKLRKQIEGKMIGSLTY